MMKSHLLGDCGRSAAQFKASSQMITKLVTLTGLTRSEFAGPKEEWTFRVPAKFAPIAEKSGFTDVPWAAESDLRALIEASKGCTDQDPARMERNMLDIYYGRTIPQ